MITIVSGPPCSGKNTYVKNHRKKGDVVWDFDKIHSALTDEETHNHIEQVRKYIFSMRETFYNDLQAKKDIRVWILNSSPIRSVRSELAKRLDANIVYIKRSKEDCLRVAENERPKEWKSYIENYFERLEEIDLNENANIIEVKSLKDINNTPTEGMREEARKGLEWRKEYGRGGTQTGVSRARDIINGDLSISSIKRMFSFFSRHENNKAKHYSAKENDGGPTAWRIAWALWGGNAGFSWSKKKVKEIAREEENRMKVGTMINDGIELPLYDSIKEAELQAQELGGSGYHEHTMDGETYYMPFENHEQAKEVMSKVNDNMYKKEDEEEEDEDRALTGAVKKGLQKKAEDHNEKVGKKNISWNAKVTSAKLGKVFNRGIGAYKTNPGSVRPSVKSPEQWAYARVNSFLYAMEKGKFRSGKHDTDLLPSNHPVKKSMKEEKSYIMENKEIRLYRAEYQVTKDEDKDEKRVSGYAALFDTDSRDLGFRETISPDAFDGRLDDNVILTFNHDPNLILDRNMGGTLKLSVDERGLRYDATLPNTTTGNDVAELMKRGLLYESSFAFTVEEDDWSKDGDITRREIKKIGRLVDVSIVGVGAYANTDVALRSKEAFETEATIEETPQVEEVEQKVEESFDDSKLNLLSNELKLKKRI